MTAKMAQPPFLKPGDEVAIISPAFSIDEKILNDAVIFLGEWGLKVRLGRNASKSDGPFAGSDAERLSDLQEMTNDHKIKAVICSRGGYGVSRIISRTDFSALHKYPKWYVGFSDITVLHLWLNEVCGIISLHGEMPLNFYNPEKSRETFTSLKHALFGEPLSVEWEGSVFRGANVRGTVTGGNLSLICSLTGTAAEPSTRGRILIIEEVGEYYFRIDRMLTSLLLAGKFEGLSALVIGGISRVEETKIPWGRSIEDMVMDIAGKYNFPVFFNFPAGHVADNRAFYIGRKAEIGIKDSKAVLTYK